MELLARTCNLEQMNFQRIMARVFVITGALFWGFSAWGAKWAYEGAPFTEALGLAAVYAGAIMLLFIVGLFYENLAAALAAAASLAVIVWGFVAGWETGVWSIMIVFFVLPLILAAVLYYLAARMQAICSL